MDPQPPVPPVGARGGQVHRVVLGGVEVDLPVVAVAPQVAVALLVVPDLGVAVLDRAAADLAALVAPEAPEVVVGTATLCVPVAHALARALGLDAWVVLQKTRKAHLHDALSAPVRSITTDADQELLLDRRSALALAGRRAVLVDDVVSTGASVAAGLDLLRPAGADVVAVATLLTEADAWRDALGADAALVRSLGSLPLFSPGPSGRWSPQRPAGDR